MRTLALLLLALAGPASAQGLALPASTWAKDWTTADTMRQAAVTALFVVDWGQSRWIARNGFREFTFRNPDTAAKEEITITAEAFHETNPILGRHPSVGRVNNYFAAMIVGHAAISYVLPPAWRQAWQYVYIGYELKTVTHNRSIGVRIDLGIISLTPALICKAFLIAHNILDSHSVLA